LSLDDKLELQKLLRDKGYYEGKIDGYLGNKSRRAIKAFQRKQGVQPDGKPTREVLDSLKR
jgi:membrane-bound lytic murein transglycosylase B